MAREEGERILVVGRDVGELKEVVVSWGLVRCEYVFAIHLDRCRVKVDGFRKLRLRREVLRIISEPGERHDCHNEHGTQQFCDGTAASPPVVDGVLAHERFKVSEVITHWTNFNLIIN